MNPDEARSIHQAYDQLVAFVVQRAHERARLVGLNPPQGDDDQSYKVGVSEDWVTVSYFERGHYDVGDFYASTSYPVPLLFAEAEELDAFVAETLAARRREAEESRARYAAEAEAQEIARYEALKAKYG